MGAFNQEKALVGAFSVIVQPVVEPMEHYTALNFTYPQEMGYYRQCFHPRFDYPRSCGDILQCQATDFLIVFVGLLNILLLQFVLVVLMFFSQEDINSFTVSNYS